MPPKTPQAPPSPGEPLLAISELSILRGRIRLLDSLRWEVQRGEHWVILGPNGSGKTSLLSALTGYLSPTEGSIAVLGQHFGESDWRALRTQIGLVSSSIRQMMPEQEPALATVISGKYAMIDFWGTAAPGDASAAMRILKKVEASHLADREWCYLSQGERQRILIGRALMARPQLLILDEPCAGLDPVAREKFLVFLQRLGSEPKGPTLVLVTHHVEEITPAFSHALLLRAGRTVAAGPKASVLNSQLLSQTFGTPVRISQTRGSYRLRVTLPPAPHNS
jgi:iron complex transport system ATP-binding protein